ncbi:MAG TPA: hypothetical protein VJL07_05680 [Dehalococcoidia bacterium]|nr:hypothetical protein [Dehalococcoidia bacterium]
MSRDDRFFPTLLLVAILLFIPLSLLGVAYAMEQRQTRDCCRDLGSVKYGVEAALNSIELDAAKKRLVGSMESAGYICEPDRSGVWTCH